MEEESKIGVFISMALENPHLAYSGDIDDDERRPPRRIESVSGEEMGLIFEERK